ncbi:MAG: glutathione peroxidase, partial [Oxalobacteraceae bacterium]
YVAPQAQVPEPVVMFSRPGCPHCARARHALQEQDIHFTDISEDQKINSIVLRGISGRMTWPQVFVGGELIGGADDVQAWLANRT